MKKLYQEGKLNEVQARIFNPTRLNTIKGWMKEDENVTCIIIQVQNILKPLFLLFKILLANIC